MSQADIDVPDVGWVSDSVTQQIQEQSAKYGVDAELSGYATLTRPCMIKIKNKSNDPGNDK